MIKCFIGPRCIYNDFLVLVNGKWSTWGAYTICSKTCGTGIRRRKRSCNNPPPQHGGNNCTGVGEQRHFCNLFPCPGKLKTFYHYSTTRYDNLPHKQLRNLDNDKHEVGSFDGVASLGLNHDNICVHNLPNIDRQIISGC